jgi:hypothetical protein
VGFRKRKGSNNTTSAWLVPGHYIHIKWYYIHTIFKWIDRDNIHLGPETLLKGVNKEASMTKGERFV